MDGENQKKKDAKNHPPSYASQQSQYGAIKVDEEVIAGIAAHAASSVPGVAGRVGGMTDGISEILGKKTVNKGVKVDDGDNKMTIDLNVLVYFGHHVPKVARDIQETVFEKIKAMLAYEVDVINVYIQGLVFPEDEEEREEKEG